MAAFGKKGKKGLTVFATGADGLCQLDSCIPDDGRVLYGLIKMQVGDGAFSREKLVHVHFNGQECPTVRRGRANAMKTKVEEQIGHVHATVQVMSKEELQLERFMEVVSKNFIDDSHDIGAQGGGRKSFSIGAVKKYHEASIEEARRKSAVLLATRCTAMEMPTPPSALTAIEKVKEPMGVFNWVLLKPNDKRLELHDAGSGSIEEMRKYLTLDEVLFGLVRMGFGTGRFRRTYWYFLHWTGEGTPAVKRGRFNALASHFQGVLGPFACSMAANALDDELATLEGVIEKMKRSIVVDGAAKGHAVGQEEADPVSLQAFQAALAEEAAKNAAFFGDGAEEPVGDDEAGIDLEDVEQVIANVRSGEEDSLSWVLFSLDH